MKSLTILALLLFAIPSLQAQKQEIKKAEKAVNAGELQDAAYYLGKARQIFAAARSETRAHYYVVEAEMHLAGKEVDLNQLETVSQSLKFADKYDQNAALKRRIMLIKTELKSLTAKAAISEFQKKNFSAAATLYTTAYQSTGDTTYFHSAAKSHLLAKEYEEAFSAYHSLFEMGYTGARTRYAATNIKSGEKEAFASAYMRDRAVDQRTHRKPETLSSGSKIRELLRGVATTSIQLNRTQPAILIMDKALAKSPNDKALLTQVFQLYGQLGAKDKYNQAMDLLIQQSPNDPNLYYNFAVSSAQSNDMEKAKELYKKTLNLDPTHVNAKINLASIILDQETTILEEMNSLGMSETDDMRYEELKLERNTLYTQALPYLESVVELQPKNMDVVKTLLNIYSKIGQDTKYTVLKERLDE